MSSLHPRYEAQFTHGVQEEELPDPLEKCEICSATIRTMTFKGTGVCGEVHRKKRDKVIEQAKALAP